jgi:hypothetical protein
LSDEYASLRGTSERSADFFRHFHQAALQNYSGFSKSDLILQRRLTKVAEKVSGTLGRAS